MSTIEALKEIKITAKADPQGYGAEGVFRYGQSEFRVRGGGYPMVQGRIGGVWYTLCINKDGLASGWRFIEGDFDRTETTTDLNDDQVEVAKNIDAIIAKIDRMSPTTSEEGDNSEYYSRW